MENFGVKELYDVTLKTTFPLYIGDTYYEEGEPIITFDKIQIADIREYKTRVHARGGSSNSSLIMWEDTTEVGFSAYEGIASKLSLALLSNSQLKKIEKRTVPKIERLESNENGIVELKYTPVGKLYLYDTLQGARIKDFTINGRELSIDKPYTEVTVNYEFEYESKESSDSLVIGERLINGFLRLEGKTRVKDDIDGHEKTGIVIIPHIRLMSDLSMRLGRDSGTPNTYQFRFSGYPVGEKGNKYVCEMVFLDTDIDSDF